MKQSNVHAILSELHRLLSQYTPADFATAASYAGVSKTMRAALIALAREAGQSGRGPLDDVDSVKSSRRVLGKNRRPSGEVPITKGAIIDMIRNTPSFGTSRAILEYAREFGLTIQAKPKDGKGRLARRLAEAIEAIPEPRRSQLLAGLNRGTESQTQGWLNVIKGTRP